jgi:L-asparaginase
MSDLKSQEPKGSIVSSYDRQKRVLIIYTGGTMGMKPSEDGSLAPVPGYLTEEVRKTPELFRPEMPYFDIKEYSPLLDSSCMGPADWARMATDIEENYFSYDGFVVIMGTDTMAYAASAMSFMLENLGKTVVFTGSQIPFVEIYNDARRNLVVALMMAMQDDFFPEVCICFNDTLFRGNRTIKSNSVGLEAYESPNFPPIAQLGVRTTMRKDLALPHPKGPFRVHKNLDTHMIVIKMVPGFDDSCIVALAEHATTLKAIILELYGAGNGPSGHMNSFYAALKLAREKGILVVAVSQCLKGGVSLDTYSMGVEMKNAGVVSGGDMTTAAISTKIAYLFGRGASNEVVEELLTVNMRGEVTSAPTVSTKSALLTNRVYPHSRL